MSAASAVALRPVSRPLPTSPQPPARSSRPAGDPTPLACTVAKNALEAALGADGLSTLARWLTPSVHASLARQHSIARRGHYQLKGAIGIVRIRLQPVRPGIVEAAIVAREGARGHAIAMRLEDRGGRWLITALELG